MTDISIFNGQVVINNGLDFDEAQYTETGRLQGRLQFFALLVYLTCHAYTIPVLPIGPSWAVWLRLDDLAFFLLAATWLIGYRVPMDYVEKRFLNTMILIIVLSLLSTVFITAVLFRTTRRGVNFGIFQTARLFEFTMVWLFARNIAFNYKRIAWIRRVLSVVALFIIIVSLLNVFQILTPSDLVRHLPSGFDRCGPWQYMKLTTRAIALGPLGYNPAYMAVQLSFLTVLLLGLRRRSHFLMSSGLVAISLVVVFLSGSRAGLVIFICAILVWSASQLRHFALSIVIIILFVVAVSFFVEPMKEMLPRQSEILSPGTAAGRTYIWKMALERIYNNPLILLTGVGWGNTMVYMGQAAHNLYLHIILESGILGFVFFCALGYQIVKLSAGTQELSRVFRAIFIGILIGALTQETLFPVASMGSFLGLFLCVLGIISSIRRTTKEINTNEFYTMDDIYDRSFDYSWYPVL